MTLWLSIQITLLIFAVIGYVVMSVSLIVDSDEFWEFITGWIMVFVFVTLVVYAIGQPSTP
jgi:hypothetical protein